MEERTNNQFACHQEYSSWHELFNCSLQNKEKFFLFCIFAFPSSGGWEDYEKLDLNFLTHTLSLWHVHAHLLLLPIFFAVHTHTKSTWMSHFYSLKRWKVSFCTRTKNFFPPCFTLLVTFHVQKLDLLRFDTFPWLIIKNGRRLEREVLLSLQWSNFFSTCFCLSLTYGL